MHRYSNPMIQPEPEGSTQGYPLVSVEVLRFDTSAGNPVKEILLKLNLPNHRSLKDGGEEHGDGVAGLKRRRHDLSSNGVGNLVMASGRGRLKEDLESSTWRRRQETDGKLRELSGEEAWEAIENFSQGQKELDNPPNIISEQEVANLKAQAKRLFGNENVWVEIHRGTPIEVEPLDHTKLEDLGLNTCSHDIFLSYKEIPSVDEPDPQLLPKFSPLDVNLGDERGTDPPIKPHSPDSFRMKVVDKSTINTPPLPYVTSFHPKDTYCYYHPCIDDPKKHYGFKPGLLGQGGSLGDDFSKMVMKENDWELESKEVSFLGRGLNLPV
ncbi:hypothetical protein Tco_0526035 [Tanacetum coccineum]